MNKKVCLITPSHISSNPRLVKEAIALEEIGFKIHIIFTQNITYLIPVDFQILAEHEGWTYDVLDVSKANSQNKSIRLKNTLLHKIASKSLKYYSTSIARKLSLNKNFYWQKSKAIQAKANLYIAHNLAALAIAFYAAKRTNAKCGFDIEDFHREELSNDHPNQHSKTAAQTENEFLPKVDYITAASPLIAKKYEDIFNRIVPCILNVFPKTDKSATKNEYSPLKLFWFSQTIGSNRGLEITFKALNEYQHSFELHLLGKINQHYKNQLLLLLDPDKSESIFFHEPIAPDEIFEMCTHFDIGLATEPGFSTNNDIALSNKIFTYIQCGLAVIASNTSAQAEFMLNHREIGFVYDKSDVKTLISIFNYYHKHRHILTAHQKNAYKLGQNKLNWDVEKHKLTKVIKNLNV